MIMPRFKDGSKIIQSRLAVVERQPKKIIVFVVLSIFLLGLSFYIGKEVGVFEARIFREKVSELETALDSLAESHEVIENELTVTILELEIQEKMISDLKSTLNKASGDYQSLQRSLAFYEEIFADSSDEPQSFVSGLRFVQIGQGPKYEFDLILRKPISSGRFSKSVDLSIKLDFLSIEEDAEKIVSIGDLGEFDEYPFQAVFKHFFRINGFVEIPEGFEPEIVRISTKVKGGSYRTRDQAWGQ